MKSPAYIEKERACSCLALMPDIFGGWSSHSQCFIMERRDLSNEHSASVGHGQDEERGCGCEKLSHMNIDRGRLQLLIFQYHSLF